MHFENNYLQAKIAPIMTYKCTQIGYLKVRMFLELLMIKQQVRVRKT